MLKHNLKINDTIPEASNETGSKKTFLHRKLYDNLNDFSFSEGKTFIDLWKENILYGRLNFEGRSVFPREGGLKKIFDGLIPEKIYALDFVVDAFQDFASFFVDNSGCADESIISVYPRKGWQDINFMYRKFLDGLFDGFFNSYIKQQGKHKKIISFQDFVKHFIDFLVFVIPDRPITRSKFLQGKRSSPLVSGLIIEVGDGKERHDQDEKKYIKWIKDPRFEFYKNASMRYGFFIDKNAPWRLVANIQSPAIIPYMVKNKVTTQSLFEKYYHFAVLSDIEIIVLLMMNFWNSFVFDFPTFYSEKEKRIIFRKPISEQAAGELPLTFWMEIFLRMRFLEENKKEISENKLNLYMKEASSKLKHVDFVSAIWYLEDRALNN